MKNNWRKVLAWADESQQEQDKEELSWDKYEVPFDKAKAQSLNNNLKYVTEGYVNYLHLPNLFGDRKHILEQVLQSKKRIAHQNKIADELVAFYENLVQNYPEE